MKQYQTLNSESLFRQTYVKKKKKKKSFLLKTFCDSCNLTLYVTQIFRFLVTADANLNEPGTELLRFLLRHPTETKKFDIKLKKKCFFDFLNQ